MPTHHLAFLRASGPGYALDRELTEENPEADDEPELDAVVTLQRLLD